MVEKKSRGKLRFKNRLIGLISLDALLLCFALWLSIALRYGDLNKDMSLFWWQFPIVSVVGVFVFSKLGLYRVVVRYIGFSILRPVMGGVIASALAASLSAFVFEESSFPRSAPIIFWFIAVSLLSGTRIFGMNYVSPLLYLRKKPEPVAIYGADQSGAQLALLLINDQRYQLLAFVDQNKEKRRTTIHGIRVYGLENIDRVTRQLKIKRIFVADDLKDKPSGLAVLNRLSDLPVLISALPKINDLLAGRLDRSDIQEVGISDLLGRSVVPPKKELMRAAVKSRNILITGAAGTIGSELCDTILVHEPHTLILLDHSEIALYNLQKQLEKKSRNRSKIIFLLGSIMDQEYIESVISKFQIAKVYHAAAYKHVHLVEENIISGVRNNVLGTMNLVNAIRRSPVEELVLISSDKAVHPKNVMGATKRLAEMIVLNFAAKESGKIFSLVRFGNVMRSSGSVIPLFEDQIRNGGPVTVTDGRATRYFMTSLEASQLVIQASAMASGGEIFVLDMGYPIRIETLAKKMIHLHGKSYVGEYEESDRENEIEIRYTGLRAGEKLNEKLFASEEFIKTSHPRIFVSSEKDVKIFEIESVCRSLEKACNASDHKAIKSIVEGCIEGFEFDNISLDPRW